MRIFGNIIIVVFLFFTAPSTADIKYGKIRSHDVDTMFVEEFGFTRTGYASVAVSSVSITDMPFTFNVSQPDLSRLGFYLISEEKRTHFFHEYKQNPNICVLDSKFIILLFTFRDLSPPPRSSFIKTHPVTYPNHYSLFFANCNPSTQVTMDVRTEVYNTDDDATTKNYLSVGQTQLPSLYLIFGLIYLCLSGYWMRRCLVKFSRIHIHMGAFIVMKALTLLCASGVQQHVKFTGTPPGWVVLYYKMQYIGDMLCYTLMVVMGFDLQHCSGLVKLIAIPLHVIPNVVSVIIRDIGPLNEDLYHWIGYLMQVDAIYIGIIILLTAGAGRFPEIWDTNEKPVKKLIIGVCLYVILGRLIVTLVLTGIVPYKYRWVCNAAEEIQSLLVYIILMFMLSCFPDRPNHERW